MLKNKSSLSHLIPKRIPVKQLPSPSEVTRIMVNEEVAVIARFPAPVEKDEDFRTVEILEVFYKRPIKIKKTVRVHCQFEGDVRVYIFRAYNFKGTGLVLAYNSQLMKWEFLFYDF